jgi:hypothetical protein
MTGFTYVGDKYIAVNVHEATEIIGIGHTPKDCRILKLIPSHSPHYHKLDDELYNGVLLDSDLDAIIEKYLKKMNVKPFEIPKVAVA